MQDVRVAAPAPPTPDTPPPETAPTDAEGTALGPERHADPLIEPYGVDLPGPQYATCPDSETDLRAACTVQITECKRFTQPWPAGCPDSETVSETHSIEVAPFGTTGPINYFNTGKPNWSDELVTHQLACTALWVRPNVLLTNSHCLPKIETKGEFLPPKPGQSVPIVAMPPRAGAEYDDTSGARPHLKFGADRLTTEFHIVACRQDGAGRCDAGNYDGQWVLLEPAKPNPAYSRCDFNVLGDYVPKDEVELETLGHPFGLPLKCTEGAGTHPHVDQTPAPEVFGLVIDGAGGASGAPVFKGAHVIGVINGDDRGPKTCECVNAVTKKERRFGLMCGCGSAARSCEDFQAEKESCTPTGSYECTEDQCHAQPISRLPAEAISALAEVK